LQAQASSLNEMNPFFVVPSFFPSLLSISLNSFYGVCKSSQEEEEGRGALRVPICYF
jgi:hypothetical protein